MPTVPIHVSTSLKAALADAPLERTRHKVYREAIGTAPEPSPAPLPMSLAHVGARWASTAVRAVSASASPIHWGHAWQHLGSGTYPRPVDVWSRYVTWVGQGGYPELDGRTIVTASRDVDDPSDVLRALTHLGPVLMFTPWPGHMNDRSKDWGVSWVGPDGFSLTGPFESVEHRPVLLKGIAYRYRNQPAVYVSDSVRGDAWMPYTGVMAFWLRGARFMAVV